MLSASQFQRFAARLNRARIPLLPGIVDYLTRLIFACWFPHSVKAGKGVVLGYGGLGIVIHADSVLGDEVHIDQGVTIGGNGRELGVPKIGSNVYIGAGAKILGPIMIGDGCLIGANAVVLCSLPPRSVAVGVPARIIKTDIRDEDYLVSQKLRNRTRSGS